MFSNCINLETFIIKVPEASLGDVHGVLKARQMEEFNEFLDTWEEQVSNFELLSDGEEIIAKFPNLIPLSREDILDRFPSARQPGKAIRGSSRHTAHRADLCKSPALVKFARTSMDRFLDELIEFGQINEDEKYYLLYENGERPHRWNATL